MAARSPAMGDLLEYRSPNKRREETTAWIGMVVFLGAWVMMFGALFFAYAGIRARAQIWPPPGVPSIPIGIATINTFVMALSSTALQLGIFSVQRGKPERLAPLLTTTFALGLAFTLLQVSVWRELTSTGLTPDSGAYASVFYGMTWVHAAHVVVGLGALGWMAVKAYRGLYTSARHLTVRLWAMYWHFVGIIWVLIFGTVYFI